jgi:hypothetical protein
MLLAELVLLRDQDQRSQPNEDDRLRTRAETGRRNNSPLFRKKTTFASNSMARTGTHRGRLSRLMPDTNRP